MRRRRSTRLKVITILAVVALCALALAALSAAAVHLKTYRRYDQRAAEYFGTPQLDYAQVSLFVAEDAALTLEAIENARTKYSTEFTSVSLEVGEGRRLFLDAYSCEGRTSVATPAEGLISSSLNVKVTAVGGDFFDLRRMSFVSGQPIYDDDITPERVVLDENAAWRLYGASDVAGMTVTIDGRLFEIAGVVEASDSSYYGITPRIYMQYSVWNELNASEDPITCYEAVLPEPLTDFAYELVSGAFSLDEGSFEIKVNSERYGLLTLAERSLDIFTLGTRQSEVYYPYWENDALELENRCTLYAVSFAVCAVIAVLTAIVIAALALTGLSKFLSEYFTRRRRL